MRLIGWRIVVFAAVLVALGACDKKGKVESSKAESKAGVTKTTEKASGAGTAQTTKAGVAAGPIAKVNGVQVPRDEFDRKYAKMTKAFTTRKKDIPDNLAQRYRESILNQLIEKELLRQRIEKAGVVVPADEIKAEFENYKKMFRTDENFDRYLKSSQTTVEQIRENVEHNQAVNKLLEKESDLVISVTEAKEYYEKNRARYAIKEQIRASHILLKVDAKADSKKIEEIQKKAKGIFQDAKKPKADFAELAKKHSEGPTAKRGGDLSYFGRGRMVKEFDEIAFKMKIGDISQPVKTQFGWHVIKVTDRKEARERPFEEVRESIEKNLRARKVRKAKQELLKTLRAEAKIETFLPKPPPSDKKGGTKSLQPGLQLKPGAAPGKPPVAPIKVPAPTKLKVAPAPAKKE